MPKTSQKELLTILSKTAGIHLHKDNLRLQFKVPGRASPIRRSLGFLLTKDNLDIAILKLANIKRDIENHTYVNAPDKFWQFHFPVHSMHDCKITLKHCFDEYRLKRKNKITDSFLGKLTTVENWLKKEGFSNKLIAEITTDELNELREDKVAVCRTSSVLDYTFTLNRIFKFATEKSYLTVNPIKNLNPLEPDDCDSDDLYTINPFSKPELQRLLAVIHIPQTRRMIELLALTGMRHGEISALAWEDIDFEKGILSVKHNLTRLGNVKAPKTPAGKRDIWLLPRAVDILMEQKLETYDKPSLKETLHFKNQKSRTTFRRRVFLSRGDLPYKRPEITTAPKQWSNWLLEAKLTYRPAYQLRHTYAARMLLSEAKLNFIAKQMGHTDWGMITKIYGAVIRDTEQSQFDIIARNFEAQ